MTRKNKNVATKTQTKKNVTSKNKTHKNDKSNKSNKLNKSNKSNKLKEPCKIGLEAFEKNIQQLVVKKKLQLSKKMFIKQLMSKFAPNSVQPNDNFYDYINYQWLKKISLGHQQKYIVQVDNFRLTQDKVYQQLHNIILDYVKSNDNTLSHNLNNFYKSVIHMNSPEYSKKLSKELVMDVNSLLKEDNPWKLLAYFNKDEMISFGAPFVWSIEPDDKNASMNRCYISSPSFTILDLNVYVDDGLEVEYKKRYIKKFKQYCRKVFDECLGPNDYNTDDIFEVELEMFIALGCVSVTSKEEKPYNKVLAGESMKKYGFDWADFATHLGFKEVPEFFITTSLNYLKCGSELFLQNWNTDKWKTYWIWLLLRRIVRITHDWETITYDFHGKYERGQEAINVSNAVSSILYMSIPFNTFLTNQYVAKYEDPKAVEYVKILCEDLKIKFYRILQANKWLAPSTKKYALKKLDHFRFVYGKPDNLREDPDLNYTDVLYDNIVKIMKWRHTKFIELEGKPVIDIPMMDWSHYPAKMVGSQAYIVNASYTPSKNSIYINLGYIQHPFIDLRERGIEYNLAHVGFTIAHEMSHALDDMGSKYDHNGNLKDWWTDSDKKKFKSIQQDVIKQYEEYAARDGIEFDASIGIGEDLADISGLHICNEYLRDFQDKNNDLVIIRQLSYKSFFAYFAFQQRQLIKKNALSAQLKTNPHPLDKYRCNVPLSRSLTFRGVYNVRKGNGMWWHNHNTIW
jgi:predicted metalloendopeptidase